MYTIYILVYVYIYIEKITSSLYFKPSEVFILLPSLGFWQRQREWKPVEIKRTHTYVHVCVCVCSFR